MKLFEYRAKQMMEKYGIPIPRGFVARSASEIRSIDYPVAVKAQVLIGGRGKAGGIKFAETAEEARRKADEILNMKIKGERVRAVLLEEKLDVARELYLSLLLDRSRKSLLFMASAEGGVEIESVQEDRIAMVPVPPYGYSDFITRILGGKMKLDRNLMSQLDGIVQKLYSMFVSEDCELAEINPLVITRDGRMIAADSKITINDDALYRHPEFSEDTDDLTPLEQRAKSEGISFVQLDGDIGVIANGAGLTMATLDILTINGGRAGVFLDLGGTDDPAKVTAAFNLMNDAKPRVIFLNIFGGITKCDTVALGVKAAVIQSKIRIPVVARIRGVNDDIAKNILSEIGIKASTDLIEAAREAVRAEAN
ncbi:MAG: ADP-forming succinate--CoA ligase subunit beta [Thermoplasmata archaeon]|uniref:ADP-forming succinate--CoA ligase subunit beta n=1 Tax=Candidatus Sysuiplasma superficiale TaxID=2823368 RepID=A0A8J7YNL1_9ARCH|nr:ADP-forming succinate--CoA ligase subunit beta [Candidatus Sysuiplasma superficiale]MCL4346783.1 ADP-forming succinate--CoA ligase subunit beta [Candidatus Thermoplasmatota archaeon]